MRWLRANPIVALVWTAAIVAVVWYGASFVKLPTMSPAAPRTTVTRSGDQSLTTDRFALSGSYRIDWTATDTGGSNVGCFHAADLEPGGGNAGTGSPEGGQTLTGTTYLYDLAASSYALVVNSGCSWSVTLTPQ